MKTETEISLLATPAGRALLKHVQEIGKTHPREALRLLDAVLGDAPGESGVRADEIVGDGMPLREARKPQDEGSPAVGSEGDGLNYRGPTPRRFAQQRRVKSRRTYSAEKMPTRLASAKITPAQQKILFALVESQKPLGVDAIAQITELAIKTVENSLSRLRHFKLINTH